MVANTKIFISFQCKCIKYLSSWKIDECIENKPFQQFIKWTLKKYLVTLASNVCSMWIFSVICSKCGAVLYLKSATLNALLFLAMEAEKLVKVNQNKSKHISELSHHPLMFGMLEREWELRADGVQPHECLRYEVGIVGGDCLKPLVRDFDDFGTDQVFLRLLVRSFSVQPLFILLPSPQWVLQSVFENPHSRSQHLFLNKWFQSLT